LSGRGDLVIVSGAVGAGKTTFCKHVIDTIRNSKKSTWSVKGILAPAVFDGAVKIGIEALDLASGVRRQLAQRRTESSSGIQTQQWSLDQDTVDWCNQVLRAAVPCDLFIVDELGPLEFERDEGFQAGMTALDSGQYHTALVVVRRELLHFAEARWSTAKVHTIQDRDHALASVDQILKEFHI
jgi:nucleoside-triphosphatase THEP1